MRVARRRHRRRYHSSLVGGTILAVAVLAAGCSLLPAGDQAGSGNGDADPAAEALPVRVAAAERRDLNADLRLSGTLEPDRSAPLVSLTGGAAAARVAKPVNRIDICERFVKQGAIFPRPQCSDGGPGNGPRSRERIHAFERVNDDMSSSTRKASDVRSTQYPAHPG